METGWSQRCGTRVRLPWSPPIHLRAASTARLNVHASVAQLVERRTENPGVVSSTLTLGTIINTAVAQLEERDATNVEVAGSSPASGTTFASGACHETTNEVVSKTLGGLAHLVQSNRLLPGRRSVRVRGPPPALRTFITARNSRPAMSNVSLFNSPIAQLVERLTVNQEDEGSKPSLGANFMPSSSNGLGHQAFNLSNAGSTPAGGTMS